LLHLKSHNSGSLVVVIWCLVLSGLSAAEGQTRIYIAPDDHTDYMWSADEKTYEKAILESIDYYLDLADKTAGNPLNLQSRWNFDGSLWMWLWEQHRTPAQADRLVVRLRDGHFSMPLTFAVSTYGGMPTEAVLRSMYYAGDVERRFGLRFPLAIAMENQTLPRGLGALWAGSGAKYSWRGVCACDTLLKPVITEPRPHEIYWWKGPDGSRILMKWYSLYPSGKTTGESIGGYAEARDPAVALRFVEQDAAFHKAYPYEVVGIFGEGWDRLSTNNDSFVKAAKTFSTPKQQVIVSNETDFFQDFEKRYGAGLPEVTASFGNEWDMYSASMPELSAGVRRAVEGLRSAEGLSTLVSLKQPGFYDKRREARKEAWAALGFFWEHDWTSDNDDMPRSTRALWQRRTAQKITSYADALLVDAREALGAQIVRQGALPRFFVFNALNWARTDAVDLPWQGSEDVHVTDVATRETVPSQFVTVVNLQGERQHLLRIWASDVPSVGYKVFEVVPGKAPVSPGDLWVSGETLENADYRVKVAGSGAIVSIVSKKLGNRELVSEVDGRYVNDWDAESGTVSIADQGPVSITLLAKSTATVPRETEVTLFRDSDRIAIRNDVLANFADVRTWAFSFNLQSPDVWHEEVGAINHARLEPEGDYAARFSRLDWLTLNHFVDMSSPDGVGVTLSNADLAFMKLGHSSITNGVSTLDTSTPLISVLAGGQVDGPHLGIPAMGDDKHFVQRFALQAHQHFSAAASMRFALEHQNPLIAGVVTGGSAYPEQTFSLLSTSDPNLLLWALKPSEEGIGQGVVARFWNLDPHAAEFALKLNGGISKGWNETHIETDLDTAPLSAGELRSHAAPWQLRTFRLQPAAR
jgi:alpha-mannosidase